MKRILILCTGNSARSQMAEGWLRHMMGDRAEVASAGLQPSVVHPLAIAVMRERGIDISHHRSKHMNEFLHQAWDTVITVCDQAAEHCPVFPGKAQRIHWSFPDPAAAEGSEEEKLQVFRTVRDAIEAQLRAWVASSCQGRKENASSSSG